MTLSPTSLSIDAHLSNLHPIPTKEASVSNNNHNNIVRQPQPQPQQVFPTIALNDLPQGIEPPETFWNVLQNVNTKYRQDLQDYLDTKKTIDAKADASAMIKNDIKRLQTDLAIKNNELKTVNKEIVQLTNEMNKIFETLQHRQNWFKQLNSLSVDNSNGSAVANNNSGNIDVDANSNIKDITNSNITPNRKKPIQGEGSASQSTSSQLVSSSSSSSSSPSNEMKMNSNVENRYRRSRQRYLGNKAGENVNEITNTNINNNHGDEKEVSSRSSSSSSSSTCAKRSLNYDETDGSAVKRSKNHGRIHGNEGENKGGVAISEENMYDDSEADDDDDNDDDDDDQTKLQHETTSAFLRRRSRLSDSNSNNDTKYVVRPRYRFPNIYTILLNHHRPLTKREIADIYKSEYKEHYEKWLKKPGDRSDLNWISFLFRCFDDTNHQKYLKDGLKIISQYDGPAQTFRIQKPNND